MTLDDLDRRIVQVIQSEFPLESRPYAALAERVGSTQDTVIEHIRRLQEEGVIRELGPVFDLRKLGYTSTLCSAQVAEPFLEPVTEFVNSFDEVTHNYLRNDPFNMWFTLIAPVEERIEEILNQIRAQEGVGEVISLPAEKIYKIKVHFSTEKETG